MTVAFIIASIVIFLLLCMLVTEMTSGLKLRRKVGDLLAANLDLIQQRNAFAEEARAAADLRLLLIEERKDKKKFIDRNLFLRQHNDRLRDLRETLALELAINPESAPDRFAEPAASH